MMFWWKTVRERIQSFIPRTTSKEIGSMWRFEIRIVEKGFPCWWKTISCHADRVAQKHANAWDQKRSTVGTFWRKNWVMAKVVGVWRLLHKSHGNYMAQHCHDVCHVGGFYQTDRREVFLYATFHDRHATVVCENGRFV
jgi:hypothetical protein